jgi:nitric oxide reductase subunit C
VGLAGRRRLFVFLIVVFFVQTWAVYSDPAGRATPPLSALAARGQKLWLDHNCQSCHQIYGFGGFLGPDLTNVARTLTDARLDVILTRGSGQMPAFHFGKNDRNAIQQFFTELDKTGVGVPTVGPDLPAGELLDLLVQKAGEQKPLSAAENVGLAIVRKQKCMACHLPNHGNPVRAPDLTAVLERLGKDKVLAVLATGVPGKLMPRFDLDAEQQAGIVAVLSWLSEHSERAERVFEVTRPGDGSLLSLPWFEYE